MKPAMNVAADIVIIAGNEILLIKRKHEPFKDMWSLPAGLVEENEEVYDCAIRELKEETGLDEIPLAELGVFSKPDRDPRGRVISIAYLSVLDEVADVEAGDDAADARWFDLDDLPELGFDHLEIINCAKEHLE